MRLSTRFLRAEASSPLDLSYVYSDNNSMS